MTKKIKEGKFLYYLCPMGPPHFWKKWEALHANLLYIYKSIGVNFDVIINCYSHHKDQQDFLKNTISGFSYINNVYTHNKRGVLTEVFLDNPHNKLWKKYDYIYWTLDDVAIKKFNFNKSIKILNEKGVSAVSPKISGAMHPWFPEGINTLNYTEIFCFFLKSKEFPKLLSCFSKSNPWFWGCDTSLGYNKFFPAVCSTYRCHHMFLSSDGQNGKKHADGCRYIQSISPHKSISAMVQSYPLIKEVICSSKIEALYYLDEPIPPSIPEPDYINTLPVDLPRKKWNALSHEEKYNTAVAYGFKDKKGIKVKISQPKYDPKANNFLPQHTSQVPVPTPPPMVFHNTLPIGWKKKRWESLSHKEKYDLAIAWGWKATNGRYLSDAQPKGYDPNAQIFFPN